jgi:hypothetical protein
MIRQFSLAAMILATLILQSARADDAASAPQQTLSDFTKAVADGDGGMLKKLVYAHSENEQKLLQAAIDYVAASKQLKEAVSTKFGAEASKELSALSLTPLDEFVKIVDAILKDPDITVAGDQATAKPKADQQGNNVCLIRDQNQWKIDATRATADWEAADWAPRIGQIKQVTAIVKQAAEDVTSGKLKSADELKAALPVR